MTRRPFNRNEADLPGDLEPTVADLERYLADSAADPAPDFSDRVMREVAAQRTPRRGLWAVMGAMWAGDRGRMMLLAATVAAAVLAVVIAGQLPRLLPSNIGSSPEPSVPTMEPSPTFTVSPRPTEPATESQRPSASPSDDEDGDTPGASDGEDQTPRPSASPSGSDDHSGPGGGGGSSPSPNDSSGSGGHSGPGGGDGADG